LLLFDAGAVDLLGIDSVTVVVGAVVAVRSAIDLL